MTSNDITRRTVLKYAGAIGTTNIIGERARAASTVMKRATTEEIRIPVTFSPDGDGPTEYEIAATLTVPPKNNRRPVVQLLVPGLTYARYYYDFPYQAEQYSYVRHATEAGYPTLNIDRIGTGESSHPPPDQLTLDAHARVLHQLIQTLQAGQIGAFDVSEVMLVGHGYGALTAVKQQAQFGNADYLILTGYTQQYAHSATLTSRLTPSETIPARQTTLSRFTAFSPGYQTTVPGERGTYYYEANVEPAVIATDDRHRATVTDAELETATEVYDASLNITVPVLEIVGDQDQYFCGVKPCTAPLGARSTEPILWPKADFSMEVLPAVGHAVFLHRTAPIAFSAVKRWAANHLSR